MPKPLVIVESPAKAKTIAGFLGREYLVEASIGHIRDLPNGSAEIPEAYKSERWARLGVDVDNDFKPLYVVPKKKKDQVRKLKGLVKEASEVYLATDEDREGESIAWHLLEVLNPRVPVKRMVFHEITRPAIERAVREWRELDRRLVDAQEARRILDRLYGYEVSAVLWKKVMNGLSAGRVQSVATRLLVERERARIRHTSASYWDVEGQFEKGGKGERFGATLVSLDHRRLATGKDFGENGRLTTGHAGAAGPLVLDEAGATGVATRLDGADFSVRSVEEKPYRRSPYPPFMTSTLQQEAGRKLRFPSQRTMRVAQDLYEQGYITYMRTDSTTLSDQALTAARAQARSLYGPAYVPEQPRRYDKKVKNAQEAHEAIRPSGETFRTPEQTRLSGDMFRLYDLIWKRTVASQMADARGQSMQVRLGAMSSSGEDAEFACSGKTIEFPGFLRAYVEGSDDPDAALEDQEVRLPIMAVGDALSASSLEPKGHATQPPARYTEASLVKAMEELGVGRPSTYAQIIENIQARGYVWKRGTALIPSWTAFAVVGLLEQHFGQLVDYGFTAQMEEDLDGIANGQGEAIPYLQRFYFGDAGGAGAAAGGSIGGAGAGASAGAAGGGAGGAGAVAGAAAATAATAAGASAGASGGAAGAGADADAGAAATRARAGAGAVAGAAGGGAGGPGAVASAGGGAGGAGAAGGAAGGGNESGASGTAGDAGRGNGSGGGGTPGGAGHGFQAGLKEMVNDQLAQIDAREVNSIPVGAGIVVRVGKYGPYIQRGEDRGQVPEDLPPDELTVERAEELLGAGSNDRVVGVDPASGLPVLARAGRFGPYVQLGGSDGGNGGSASASAAAGKPKTQSLLEGITLDTVTLDQALRLLSLPRLVGVDGDGEEIVATHGRYGPYLKKGADSRSLQDDAQLFTVSLDEARALFAQPKPGRATRSGASLRELGADPVSGQPVSVKDGRFGPYVTDGVTNASLRKGDSVEEVTIERAAELLVARREAAPRSPRAPRKAAGPASAAKKATGAASAKKAPVAKKAVVKKVVAKKAVAKKAVAKKAVAKKAPAAAKKARGTS